MRTRREVWLFGRSRVGRAGGPVGPIFSSSHHIMSRPVTHDVSVFANLGTRGRLFTSPRAPSTDTMSWQSYVDDHLIGTGHVTKGAICGVDGALWAASAGFNVRLRAPRTPRTLDVAFIRWKPRSDARSLPPARPALAGVPRGGAEDRGGYG